MKPERLLAIAALAIMVDKGDILGMTELDFCIAHDLEQEYFDGESWISLFVKNYQTVQQTLAPNTATAPHVCETCRHGQCPDMCASCNPPRT